MFPIKHEKSLEDFFINRFGRELYLTFFKDYTEKVWGVPCNLIPPDWGAQRVKGLSIGRAILDALTKLFRKKDVSLTQKDTETSLIERFLYPKYGAGHMYQEIAQNIISLGGEISTHSKIIGLATNGRNITEIKAKNTKNGQITTLKGDYYFSTMPIKDLINGLSPEPPREITEIANGLMYRDYIIVGLLLYKMVLKNNTKIRTLNDTIPDNWIYVQESDVKVGRLDIFNNFSPYMLKDINKIWLGAEYFCNEGDEIWNKSDDEMKDHAIEELEKIDIIDKRDVIDGIVLRMPKVYPSYFGSYNRFNELVKFFDKYENLFLIGRNGMHKYNNMDHSILSGMIAVDNIISGIKEKDNLWALNTEQEYHEQKK